MPSQALGLILEGFLKNSTLAKFSNDVWEYFLTLVNRALKSAEQNPEKIKVQSFLIKVLGKFQNALKAEDPNNISSNLLRGKIDKSELNISHSVIF